MCQLLTGPAHSHLSQVFDINIRRVLYRSVPVNLPVLFVRKLVLFRCTLGPNPNESFLLTQTE